MTGAALLVLTLGLGHGAWAQGMPEPGRAAPARPPAASPRPLPGAFNSKDLVEAARRGDAAKVKALLDVGADPDSKKGWRWIPPFFFVRKGETALCAAAKEGHADVVKLLLEKGADRRIKCKGWYAFAGIVQVWAKGYTPLLIAAWSGHAGVVRELLNEPKEDVIFDLTHQDAAMSGCSDPACSTVLIDEVLPLPKHYDTALTTAENKDYPDVVQAILEAAGPNALILEDAESPINGRPALPPTRWAVEKNHPELLQWMRDQGWDMSGVPASDLPAPPQAAPAPAAQPQAAPLPQAKPAPKPWWEK